MGLAGVGSDVELVSLLDGLYCYMEVWVALHEVPVWNFRLPWEWGGFF